MKGLKIGCLLIPFLVTTTFAQVVKFGKPQIKTRPGHFVVESKDTSSVTNKSELRLIVRFKSDPLLKGMAGGRANFERVENEHQQFGRDLQRFAKQNSSGRSVSLTAEIIRSYRYAFNGVPIKVSAQLHKLIAELPYVSSTCEDAVVTITDGPSSDVIQAPRVWNELGVTGKGIVIGIIDTGINYGHPDFGGGIGPFYKVVGGYDFVNNDDDPADDNGHGTHVAGIAASKAFNGIAPDAKLLAIKVLSGGGAGTDSQVLAGIEYAVNPDGNLSTNDAPRVVNMSIGRAPTRDEPLSEAVNNAVAAGIVFVVAAGNQSTTLSVQSPGIAENAITVGATTLDDRTADFSSRGPLKTSFSIKPDLSAPGVEITSAFLGMGYATLSGTSMSAPHVAGAVALLLELHPDWSAETIKSALMNTAVLTSGTNLFEQGAGRIDVWRAVNAQLLVSPGSFSFGRASELQPIWSKRIIATVTNLRDVEQVVAFRTEGSITNSDIEVAFTPESLIIPARGSAQVAVTLTTSPASLPLKNLPDAYNGVFAFESALDTVKAPVALIHAPATTLSTVDELPEVVLVSGTNGSTFTASFFPEGFQTDLFLPKGLYDFTALYKKNTIVVAEAISTDDNRVIPLQKSLAINQVIFEPHDDSGKTLAFSDDLYDGSAMFSGVGRNISIRYNIAEDTFHISNQHTYHLDFELHGSWRHAPEKYYELNLSTPPEIMSHLTIRNNVEDFNTLDIYNPSVDQHEKQTLNYVYKIGGFTWARYVADTVMNPVQFFYMPRPANHQIANRFILTLNSMPGRSGYRWESGVMEVTEQGIDHYTLLDSLVGRVTRQHDEYVLGESLVRCNAYAFNEGNKALMITAPSRGIFHRYYGEQELGTISYQVWVDGILSKTGTTGNQMLDDLEYNGLALQADVNGTEIKTVLEYNDYQVQGKFGAAKLTHDFNMTRNDRNPPYIASLSFEANERSTTHINVGESATLKFTIEERCFKPPYYNNCETSGVRDVEASIQVLDGPTWFNLVTVPDGVGAYHAIVPPTMEAGYYSLRVVARDNSGNSTQYVLQPAFLVGNPGLQEPYHTVTLIKPIKGSKDAGIRPTFVWTDIPGAAYLLQVSRDKEFGTLILEQAIATASVTPNFNLELNQRYYWRIKASASGKADRWSPVFDFYSAKEMAPVLYLPQNGTMVKRTPTVFEWSEVALSAFYVFQLSTTSDFAEFQDSILYKTNRVQIGNLSPNTHYYWRVYASFFIFPTFHNKLSSVHEFTTSDLIVSTEADQTCGRLINYPNPFYEQTNISSSMCRPGPISLFIYDNNGKQVVRRDLVSSNGSISFLWDGKNDQNELVPDGMYTGVLRTNLGVKHIKLALIRK